VVDIIKKIERARVKMEQIKLGSTLPRGKKEGGLTVKLFKGHYTRMVDRVLQTRTTSRRIPLSRRSSSAFSRSLPVRPSTKVRWNATSSSSRALPHPRRSSPRSPSRLGSSTVLNDGATRRIFSSGVPP
ncbi:MAG: hypothetical protein ACREYE_20070, partial [Gammaproteobacteria bacterium]